MFNISIIMFNISIAQINMTFCAFDQMRFTILSRNQINSNQMLVLEEKENRSTQRKTSRSRVEYQQTQPTYDAEPGNRTRATLVGPPT